MHADNVFKKFACDTYVYRSSKKILWKFPVWHNFKSYVFLKGS